MKKRYLLFFLVLYFITGCENQDEIIKNEYIAMKNETFNDKNYKDEELPFDIVTTVDRINEELINYKVVIKNPKEDMHDIKAMVVHNFYHEDLFPSIGLFNEPRKLLVDSNKTEELVLMDRIQTTKNISKLGLQFKIWVENIDYNGEKKDIYYKTT